MTLAIGAGWALANVRECPPNATLATCASQLAHPLPSSERVRFEELGRRLSSGEAPAALRRELASEVRWSRATATLMSSASQLAADLAQLAELRIHAEVVRLGRCPTDAELASPPFTTLRAPTALGESLRVMQPLEPLDVWPPISANKQVPWPIECPSPRKP